MWRLYLLGTAAVVLALAGSHLWAYEHGRSTQAAQDNVAGLRASLAAEQAVSAQRERDAKNAALAAAAARDRAIAAEQDLAAARGQLSDLEASRDALPLAPACASAEPVAPAGPAEPAQPRRAPIREYRCPLTSGASGLLNRLGERPADRPADSAGAAH